MRSILVALGIALVLTGSLVPPLVAHGDNNLASAPCKDGGWQTLERSDGTPFATQGECVSYAVQGGDLQPLVVATIWISSSVVAPCPTTPSDPCEIFALAGSGFEPLATLSVTFVNNNGYESDLNFDPPVTDGDGAFVDSPLYWPCGGGYGTTSFITVTDGLNTATTTQFIDC